jgi:hypothetical protein
MVRSTYYFNVLFNILCKGILFITCCLHSQFISLFFLDFLDFILEKFKFTNVFLVLILEKDRFRCRVIYHQMLGCLNLGTKLPL